MSELEEVYSAAYQNLNTFREFIQLYEAGDNEKLKPSKFHESWGNELLYGTESIACEGFRECGKTSIIKAFLLHCLTFPTANRSYIALMRGNKTGASKIIKEVAEEYKRNPLMSGASLGSIQEDSAEAFCIKSKCGLIIRIEAYGKGSSIRGASYNNRRPDIVILDDIQDKEDMRSETIPENDWDWFLSDIKFLGKATRFFMIGNNLGEKCIIEKLINTANADRKGLFGFMCYRVPAIVDGVSTWGERFSVEYLMAEREEMASQGKLGIWLMERMCQAVAEETRVFKTDWIKRYDYQFVSDIAYAGATFCALDPASSTKNTSCYRAFVVISVDTNNNWHIIDVDYGRWDSVELMDHMFALVKKWKLLDVGIEKGHYEQVIKPFIELEMSRRNCFFGITPLEHARVGSKLERIKMLAPRYAAGNVFHPQPQQVDWCAELESEMAGVTKDGIKSEYIDLVDALAMLQQTAEPPLDTADERAYNPFYGKEMYADNDFVNE